MGGKGYNCRLKHFFLWDRRGCNCSFREIFLAWFGFLLMFSYVSLITLLIMKVWKVQKMVSKFRSHLLPGLDFALFPSNSHSTQVSPLNWGILSRPKSNKLNLNFLRDFVVIKDSFNMVKPFQEFIRIKLPFKLWNLNLMILKVRLSLFSSWSPRRLLLMIGF